MLRLTLVLGAVIYAGLVILSEQASLVPADHETVSRAAAIDVTQPVMAQNPDHFMTADGRRLRIAAVIDPIPLASHQIGIAHVSTRPATALADTAGIPASVGLPDAALIEVTGTAVNLRAGPSTGDAVLTALVRGDRAELIEASGNGWAQVRTLPDGMVGYLWNDFITPLN